MQEVSFFFGFLLVMLFPSESLYDDVPSLVGNPWKMDEKNLLGGKPIRKETGL